MNWKIWSSILFLVTFVLIWNYRFDLRKGKLKFILYTISNCITLPVGVFAFSSILLEWIQVRNIVGTPNCSLEGFPLCFLGHSIFFVVLIFLFSGCSILAWKDYINKKLHPEPVDGGFPFPTFKNIYYYPPLIEKNWVILPVVMVLLVGIWAGVI